MEGKFLYCLCVLMVLVSLFIYMIIVNKKQVLLDMKNIYNNRWIMGVVLFTLILTLPVLVFGEERKLTWLNYTELYAGIDRTFKISPQCLSGAYNDRMTSNGGIKQNILMSYDKDFSLNTKYTHHSCAINNDRNSYDAIGLELLYHWDW